MVQNYSLRITPCLNTCYNPVTTRKTVSLIVADIVKKHKIGKLLMLFRQNPYTYIIIRINFVVEKV